MDKRSLVIISSLVLVTGIIFLNFDSAQAETEDEKAKKDITKSIGSAHAPWIWSDNIWPWDQTADDLPGHYLL